MNEASQQLTRRLAGLAARRSGLAFGLWGEAGVGKTHTALALLRNTPCQAITVHSTQAFVDIVRAIPRPKKTSIWLEPSLERLLQGDTLETSTLVQMLVGLLTASAPLILHVEDLHEAPSDRLEVWQQLASAVTRTRGVGLVATSRAHPPDGFEAIRLESMNRLASDVLLEAEAGASLPDEALAWIFEHAQGNPLFSLEFFRFLARQGFLWNDNQRWRWREPERRLMPITVEALVEQTLRQAAHTPTLEAILESKAILGLNTDQHLWSVVAGLGPDDLEVGVQALKRQGVFRAEEFAHPLYGEVLARNLPTERRRAMARRALEAHRENPRVAARFLEDVGLEATQALEILEAAVQAAREAGSPLQAARFLAQATQHATGFERARLALEAAQGLRQADLSRAIELAEVAGLEPALEVQAAVLVAEILAVQGKLAEAKRRLEHLSIPALERSVLSLTLHGLALDFAGVLAIWHETPELQAGFDPRVVRAVAGALLKSGRADEARPLVDQALSRDNLNAEDRLAFEGHQILMVHYEGKNEAAAELWAERALRLRALGDLRGAALALYNQGVAVQLLMHLRLSIDLSAQAARLYLEAGDLRSYTQTLIGRAWVLWHLTEYQEAETLLLEGCGLLQGMNASDLLVECEGILSLMYLDWSPPLAADLAAKHASASVEVARRLNNPNEIVSALYDLVMARLRQGRLEVARELVEEMVMLRATHQLKGMASNTVYCQAMVLEAMGHKEKALELMRSAEANHQGGQTYKHKIGIEVARMSGDLAMARQHLEWFQTNQMFNGVEVLRRYFPEITLAASDSPKPQTSLRLEVLGSMQLVIDGTRGPVRGGKRKELLALLLEARIMGRAGVSNLNLFDALYADVSETQASTALSSLVHQLREQFGPDIIFSGDAGYTLGGITSDAEVFLETGDTRLWRGEYLEGSDFNVGDTVRETLHLALRNRAEPLLETDPTEAVRVGRLLCEADPYNLESLRLTLQALRAASNHKGLKSTYARARTDLLEIGEVLPERWADFLETPTGKSA